MSVTQHKTMAHLQMDQPINNGSSFNASIANCLIIRGYYRSCGVLTLKYMEHNIIDQQPWSIDDCRGLLLGLLRQLVHIGNWALSRSMNGGEPHSQPTISCDKLWFQHCSCDTCRVNS